MISEDGLKNEFHSKMDNRRSLVIGDFCHSANMLDDIGGRTGFGYTMKVSGTFGKDCMTAILPRMNGRTMNQTARRTGVAVAHGGPDLLIPLGPWLFRYKFEEVFQVVGNQNITLCPSVENDCDTHARPWGPGARPPPGPGAGRQGRGFIEFDTDIDVSIQKPEKVLTYQVESGRVILSDFTWRKRNVEGTLRTVGVDFKYRTDCNGDFKVVMRAVAGRIYSSDLDQELKLDGNDSTENQKKEGEAPHLDDFVWSFED